MFLALPPSNPKKNLLPIHAQQDQPKNGQHDSSFQHGCVDRPETLEDLRAEMPFEVASNKAAHELPKAVHRDRVQADDHEGKCRRLISEGIFPGHK